MSANSRLRVPKYRLHKSRGLAKVRINGRDIYLGPYGSPESHALYKRVVAEWLASNASPVTQPRTDAERSELTVNELVFAFLEHAKTYYVRDGEETGEVQNLRYAVKPMVELYGGLPVVEFGPVALKAVRQVMIDLNWCRSLVNGRVNCIRRVFKWGVENEMIPPSSLHALQAVAGLKRGRCSVRESDPVKPVPDAVVEATCAAAPPTLAAMIRVQRLTGMRPGELVVMRTCDIDTSGKIWRFTPMRHKTEHHGRSRVVYLGPQAQRGLKPFLRTDVRSFIFSPSDALGQIAEIKRSRRKTRVQPSQVRRAERAKGRDLRPRYTTGSYARAIAYACDRAFPHPELSQLRQSRMSEEQLQTLKAWRLAHRWSPNQLRHSAATFLRKQFGIEAARVVLGHSSADVTEIYAEQDLSRAAEVMGRVG